MGMGLILVIMLGWSKFVSWSIRCFRLIMDFGVVVMGGDTVAVTEA
jgi:hypothetical protein